MKEEEGRRGRGGGLARAPPTADSGSEVGKGRGRVEPACAEEAARRDLGKGWTSTRVGVLCWKDRRARETKKI